MNVSLRWIPILVTVTAMSIRAFLYAESGSKPKKVAESKTWIPLCWLSTLSIADVERETTAGYITTNRKEAIERCAESVPFLMKLFPEYQSIQQCADAFMALLKKTRAVTLAVEMSDHFAIAPDTFHRALVTAVKAVEVQDMKCSFTVPARQIQNAFTGKPATIKATTLRTTRDVLCHVAGLNPATNDVDIERDQLIGCLLS